MKTITLSEVARRYNWSLDVLKPMFEEAKIQYKLVDNVHYFDNDGDPQLTLLGYFYVSRILPSWKALDEIIMMFMEEEKSDPFTIIRTQLDILENTKKAAEETVEKTLRTIYKANPPKDDKPVYAFEHSETLGQLLKRAQGNRTKVEMAKIFNISPSAFYYWVNDVNCPNPDKLDTAKDSDLYNGITVQMLKDACHPSNKNYRHSNKMAFIKDEQSELWRHDIMKRITEYGKKNKVGSSTILTSMYTYMNRVLGYVSEQNVKEVRRITGADCYISTLMAISMDETWRSVFENLVVDLESSSWMSSKFKAALKPVTLAK